VIALAAQIYPESPGLDGYLPIADHGVIGDLRSVALVGTDGTIDWFCPERFDAPSVFGAILDRTNGGYYRIAPAAKPPVRDRGPMERARRNRKVPPAPIDYTTKQLYVPDTNVLITRFLSPAGVAEVQDFMPVGDGPQRVIRRVVCVRGEMNFRLDCEPRFDYGRDHHEVVLPGEGALFRSPTLSLALSAPTPLVSTGTGVTGRFTLAEGESATFVLEEAADGQELRALTDAEAQAEFERTVQYWLDWICQSTYTGRWRETVNRSALALKLLTYAPTGAIVAAATTSLPEQLGGGRNWDYRFTWIRDAAFTLYALMRLGFAHEAEAFGKFLSGCFRASKENGSGPLQLMYGIDGRTDLPEEVLDHLEGYEGSAPVRIGNGAAHQLQLDIYGELLDAAYLVERYSHNHLSYEAWQGLAHMVEWVCENWDRPDEGIWETRGGAQRFTHSRLMCWVALDRAVRIARDRSFPADIVRWMAVRDEIYRRLMERSWSERRQAFVQHEDTDVLDASVLLMPLVHFIAPTDPRWLSTLDAIGNELVSDSLVYRYDPHASPDGLDGDEGTFSICSFWYVEALSRAGRVHEARLAFEKMLTYANHLGLYSEEIGSSGELLGNFPQAFTHLALISAAVNLDGKLG
jgi:GH15 family glucan-1,4-alpha-glucosidase